jgi:triacylglycerol lipase
MAFDPNASTHTAGNALFLGEASRVAYQPATAADWLRRNGFSDAVAMHFDVSGISGLTVSHPHFTLLVFTGTNSAADWGINLSTLPVSDPGGLPGKIHHGFLQALDRVWAGQVLPRLAVATPLWVTGHSLGGALAALAAARCALTGRRPVQGLYTYGQPRAGNDDFRDALGAALSGRYFRYVNDRDIVPRVPPAALGFRHAGHGFLFTPEYEIRELSPAQEFAFAVQRALQEAAHLDELRGRKLLESVGDHDIESYLGGLRKAAG